MPTFNGTAGDDNLVGTNFPAPSGNDTINGFEGNDTLSGLRGNDSLRGGIGVDHLIGGDGDDWLTADPFKSDGSPEDGGDVIEGGAGIDTLYYTTISGTVGVTVNLAAGTGSGGATLSGIEKVTGSNYADSLTGDAGDNELDGGLGLDTLSGGDGDDTLRDLGFGSSSGPDHLDGGAGKDFADYGGNVSATIDLAAGTINGLVRLTSIEDVRAAGSITGNAEDNNLIGVSGSNDTLHGAAGNDRLTGGGGSDSLYGEAGDDVLYYIQPYRYWLADGPDLLDGGGGIDTVDFSRHQGAGTVYLNLQTGTGLDGDVSVTLVSIENLIGSNFDYDTLIGDGGSNVLDGRAGGDDLQGGGGDDLLRGGADGDQLDGGAGDDTASYYYLNTSGVNVDLATGIASAGNFSDDTLVSIENVTGSQINDTLTGNAGANVLGGWGGNDVLRGGAGDDVLRGGTGADQLEGGIGIDTASFYEAIVGVAVDLAAGTGSGGEAQGDTYVGIQNLSGSQGNDSLSGNAEANVLAGWGGADVLRGGAGADRLDGGVGSDTASYYQNTTAVTVNLATGAGSGGAAAGDTYVSIENVNGSTAADQITGSAQANALNGWAGQDVLRGGGGADRFVFSAASHSAIGAADRITDFSHAQSDRVDLSSVDANTGAAGNQAFTFIGSSLYTGVAGQLRYASDGAVTIPGVTTIAGDINGDRVSDFHIQLTGAIGLVAADFVL
jgi:Ca2+-binding RTX toxin-like protein